MDVHVDDYTFESILGKGTFGYIIIWNKLCNYMYTDQIYFLWNNVCTFRTVYLVRRKKDSKPFVIKAQDLNVVNKWNNATKLDILL